MDTFTDLAAGILGFFPGGWIAGPLL